MLRLMVTFWYLIYVRSYSGTWVIYLKVMFGLVSPRFDIVVLIGMMVKASRCFGG